jgi:integration host factor subunit alpha
MEELLLKNDPIMKKNVPLSTPLVEHLTNPEVLQAEQFSQDEDAEPAEDAKPALTKAELADFLFDQLGLNKREAKDFVDGFFDEIRQTLETGVSVKVSGFGHFLLRDKPERPGRNPKTGEEIPIAARRVVTFHPSQKLKGLVESTQPVAGELGGASSTALESK